MNPSPSSYACPRCREALVTVSAPDVVLHGCASCGGIWLSEEDSRKAIGGLASPTVDMVKAAGDNAKRAPDRSGWIACPDCGKRMERNVYEPARVDIDYCAGHGSWFDKGELYAVHRAATGTLPPPPMAPMSFDAGPLPTVIPQTSTMAIVGLILAFFCPLIGLIVSVIAHGEIRNSGGRLTGEGFATAGIVIAILSMLLGCLISIARHH